MKSPVNVPHEVVEWKVSQLKAHPANGIFPDLSPHDFQAMVTDIRANGLQHPLEILPDGTLLAGHQRLRAVKKLKQETVACIVRKDLAALSPEEQEAYLLRDNLNRRNLSMLQRVRILYANLPIVEQLGRDRSLAGESPRETLLKMIEAQSGCSRKTALRWLAVAATPTPIQDAVEQGQLKLVDGEKFSHLKEKVQREAAQRIEAGESAQAVVNEVLGRQPAPSRGRNAKSLLGTLTKFVQKLESEPFQEGEARDVLRRLPTIIEQLSELQDSLAAQLPTLAAEAEAEFESQLEPRFAEILKDSSMLRPKRQKPRKNGLRLGPPRQLAAVG